MRFKKGAKVEVLKSDAARCALWIPAEITAGNGHYYSVRYEQESRDDCGAVVERVPRKLIRPPPPRGDLSRSGTPGDVVEMFDRGMWKPVTVSKVAGDCCYQVQLPGCLETFEVHRSTLRARQIWQDDQWILVGKELGVEPDQRFNEQGPSYRKTLRKDAINGHSRKRKLNVVSCGAKRVSAINNLPAQPRHCANKMQTALGNDGIQWRHAEDNSPPLPQKGQRRGLGKVASYGP